MAGLANNGISFRMVSRYQGYVECHLRVSKDFVEGSKIDRDTGATFQHLLRQIQTCT